MDGEPTLREKRWIEGDLPTNHHGKSWEYIYIYISYIYNIYIWDLTEDEATKKPRNQGEILGFNHR